MPPTPCAGPPCKSTRKDRIIYTFPLVSLPNESRQSALVLVWHEYGLITTHFIPDIAILKENGEVIDGS